MTKTARLARKYQLATLIAVTGVKPVTFHAWRARNNLFPRTMQEQGWKYYSIADICVTRAVAHLTRNGSSAQFAVDVAMALLPRFEAMVTADADEPFENCFAFAAKIENEEGEAGELDIRLLGANAPLSAVPLAAGVLLDLSMILGGVIDILTELAPETIASAEETVRILAKAASDALRSSLEAEEEE